MQCNNIFVGIWWNILPWIAPDCDLAQIMLNSRPVKLWVTRPGPAWPGPGDAAAAKITVNLRQPAPVERQPQHHSQSWSSTAPAPGFLRWHQWRLPAPGSQLCLWLPKHRVKAPTQQIFKYPASSRPDGDHSEHSRAGLQWYQVNQVNISNIYAGKM